MNFDKILEYQKIDQELIALENEVAKSEERSRLAVAKSRLDGATQTIGKLSAEASELLSGYDKMKAKIDELKARLDELDGVINDSNIEDENEADYYIRQVSAIADEIASLERQSSADSKKIESVNDNYKKTWEQGIKASDAYKVARGEYDKFVKERQPRVAEISKELSALKKDIPERVMEVYQTLRQAKKMPAFVEYDPKANVCGRCFMDVPNDTKAKLKNAGDFTECPNCRRILYIPEK